MVRHSSNEFQIQTSCHHRVRRHRWTSIPRHRRGRNPSGTRSPGDAAHQRKEDRQPGRFRSCRPSFRKNALPGHAKAMVAQDGALPSRPLEGLEAVSRTDQENRGGRRARHGRIHFADPAGRRQAGEVQDADPRVQRHPGQVQQAQRPLLQHRALRPGSLQTAVLQEPRCAGGRHPGSLRHDQTGHR